MSMDCPAFVGLDLRTSAIIIALLGMVHWIACAVPSRRFRSEFFVVLYVLAAVAGLVSLLLLVGILARSIVLYWVWIVFTVVYVAAMVVALLVMLIGFNTLHMRHVALAPLLALFYYILTLYFICVVNSHRREVQRSGWLVAGGAVGRAGGGGAADASADSETLRDSTAVTMSNTSVEQRGSCVVPSVNPPNGAYYGTLPDQKSAQPRRAYERLRLWVSCREHHRPRHLPHALCYSGGWNLPLPECVREPPPPPPPPPYYEVHEEYYEDPRELCVLPRPPDHGYFTSEEKISNTHISLAVRCNSLHFLVGWQRLTCHDGHWNRPMPKCMFMDITVCTLLKRTDGMIRTCLASEHYEGTYRCDRGVVPHGTAVEPRCRRDHFVWGPFRYMHCMNGEWHPRDVTWQSIACEHTTDIYRHYEIEERKTSTTPEEPLTLGDNATITNATDTFRVSIQNDKNWAEISPQMEEFFTRNFTKMNIWKRKNKTDQSNTKMDITDVWKVQIEREQTSDSDVTSNNTGKFPGAAGKPLKTNSAIIKLRNPQIDKTQDKSFNNSITKDILQSHRQAFIESMEDDSIRTNFWKLQKEALKVDTTGTKSANKNIRNPEEEMDEAQTESFKDSSKNNILQSHRQGNESLDDDSIQTNYWKLQKETLKADAIDTSLWKIQRHAGVSINKAGKTKIRNTRNELGEKPITNTNKTYLWSSETKLRPKSNQISIWKSKSENHCEMLNAKSNKISIWKPQSPQTSGYSSTSSNELSIWKSQSEDFGNRLGVNSKKISIWKTDNAPSESLGADWTKHNIRKTHEDSGKLVHRNLNKIKNKHFRKKPLKWLGIHSDRLLGSR